MARNRALFCHFPWSGLIPAAMLLLVTLALTLGPARRAAAQPGTTHIVVSEVVHELDTTDRSKQYIEFANLGTADFDFKNCWIYVNAQPPHEQALIPEVMIQIAGTGGTDAADASKLVPVKPGGVLLIEWDRPNSADSFPGIPAGPNVFPTGHPSDGSIANQNLRVRTAIALFAPQSTKPALASADPTFGGATMLAYYFQGAENEDDGVDTATGAALGMQRAAQLGLWEFGKGAPVAYDSATSLRWPSPAPGQPFPAAIGRRVSDYYVTRYGVTDLSNAMRDSSAATAGRYGSPGQPNLQFAGATAELIPGQTLPNGYSLLPFLAAGTTATTTAGSPAAAIHIAAVTPSGAIVTNILNGSTWSGWQYVGGPSVIRPLFVDNPKSASRSLYSVDAFSGQLYVNRYVVVGSNPAAYQGWQAIGGVTSDGVAAAVDATSGSEAVVYDDASGVTNVVTGSNGTYTAAKALPSSAKLANVSIASTASGFVVLGFDSTGQLMQSVLAADGTPGALSKVGSAITNRPLLPAVARFNATAGQLEILVAGAAGALQLMHEKIGSAPSAAINVGISTDAQPALAINTDNGDLMVLARGADLPVPSGEEYNPTMGQALTAILRNAGTSFLTASRVGLGLMPPGIAPDVFYSANTKQYVQLLVGDDFQLYRNTAAP